MRSFAAWERLACKVTSLQPLDRLGVDLGDESSGSVVQGIVGGMGRWIAQGQGSCILARWHKIGLFQLCIKCPMYTQLPVSVVVFIGVLAFEIGHSEQRFAHSLAGVIRGHPRRDLSVAQGQNEWGSRPGPRRGGDRLHDHCDRA